ncbi:nuclear cap-binding protein subunit 1-like protein [Dinothrombium tinctorium]|uniref:Nuclear cap-binding protein subunit 1 n=1 Tax=Dinothrombium tinctorium TaxID=1965070 RepID=A0A3S4RHZ8_9ACAR|nr:nuclear cap-binding protein subunit 1-like protein [Dinothrombium tinctorium]
MKFGGEVVEKLTNNFKDYLKSCNWSKASSLIRFFGDLCNCHVISASSLLNLFETLVDVTMEDNIPQARSDFYVYSVLSALPFVGKELNDKNHENLEQLLNNIENYISKRSKTHHTALRVWYSDSPHPQEEYLDCLWAQISKLRSEKWVEKCLSRPYLSLDSVLCEALTHNLPQIQIPPHESSFIYPNPRVIFRLFDYTDCPEDNILPGAHNIERFLIEEHMRWIIDQNYFARKEWYKIDYLNYINKFLFSAIALLSFPGLLKQKIPLEYMVVEVILGELFTLPKSKYLEICYGSLLLELCKLQPSTLPQVLAQAVELLYDRLDSMNVDCIGRFASWFAYHLSNFQFSWDWDGWSTCLTADNLSPKQRFVRETLQRCMRLSYHQRIAEIVPETFQCLLPDLPAPNNKFAEDETGSLSGTPYAQKLLNVLKEKHTPEEALEVLKDIPNPLQESEEEPSYNPLKINVFLTCLLCYLSKSFTHLFAGFAKYQLCLKSLNTSEEAQICILKTMFEVWNSHQQLIILLTKKFLKAGIVQHSAVANWLFSKDMSAELTKSYVWELLHETILQQVKTVEKIEKELEEAKEPKPKSEDGKEAGADGDIPMEEMVEKLEEKLESAQSDQKNLFLIIFQRFIMLLSEHIQSCESQNKSFKNLWFRWMIGRLQQVFFEHQENVFKYVSTLESLLFTPEVDQHILLIFRQFCSLRA